MEKPEQYPLLSRRKFMRNMLIGGAGLLVATEGIDFINYLVMEKFYSRWHKLTSELDKHPGDPLLQAACSAFINSNFFIAGGPLRNHKLPAINLAHYIYGEGRDFDGNTEIRAAINREFGNLCTYLSSMLSYSLSNAENIFATSFNGQQYFHNIGIAQGSLPPLDHIRTVVSPPGGVEISNALARHTLEASFTTSPPQEIAPEHADPALTGLMENLHKIGQNFGVTRVLATPVSDITIHDVYYYQRNNRTNAANGSMNVMSPEVAQFMKFTSRVVDFSKLPNYLGQQGYDELMRGLLSVDSDGMSMMEEVGVAKRFNFDAAFTPQEAGTFPVDLLILQ